MMPANLFSTFLDSRLVFGLVFLVGLAVCSFGVGRATERRLWMHPLTLAGCVLGAAALLLIVQGLFRLQIVPVSYSLALALVVAIAVLKALLARLYPA